MRRIIIFSLVAFVLWGPMRLAVAEEDGEVPSEKGIEVRLIPVTTSAENGIVTMVAKLKLINKMDVDVRDIQVSASAEEQVQVSPERVNVDYLAARSEIFAGELVTVVSPEPGEQENAVDHGLIWAVKYHIIESKVTKEGAPEIPSSGMAAKKSGKLRKGIGLSEIMFCPVDPNNEAEWVELYNDSNDKAANIAGYELCNASGTVYRLPNKMPPVPPKAFVLVLFDGLASIADDVSFEGDNLAVLHVGKCNLFADEGDICALFAGKSRSRKAIRGFVTWGEVKKKTENNDKRSKRTKSFLRDAIAEGLWKRGSVKTFDRIPDIEGPSFVVKKGGSLVLLSSNGVRPGLTAVPCGPEEGTPGCKNVVPAPQLWLPHNELQTSADLFTFSWLKVGTSVYDFELYKNEECTELLIEAKDLSKPSFRPASPLDRNATYYWRVRSIIEDNVSGWSETRKFTVGYPEGTGSVPFEDSTSKVVVLAVGDNPLGVPSRAARKDSSLLCVDGCDEAHWDADNSGGDQHDHSRWYCWAAAAQMLAMYRGGDVLQDEIVANVKGGSGTDPEDSLPHDSHAGASREDGYHSLRFVLQATQAELHVTETRPSDADLRAFIDADRPIRYSTGVHAMVVDGYRTTSGGVFETRFLNTDNDGTVEWRPWATHPFVWCAIPDDGLTGRTTDSRVTTDSDVDGMMDFDEDERFPTDKDLFDTDDDYVGDKADVASYALRGIDADVDSDETRGEVDEDSDNGGATDGLEDLDHDGKYEPGDGETDPHDSADDPEPRIDLILCIDNTGSMWDDIAAAKSAATDIVNSLLMETDARIALVTYKDFPVWPYGGTSDYAYRDVVSFTDNVSTLVSGINSMSASGGADWRESVYSALMHCIDATTLGGWRGEPIKKTIILMGDAPPHDPEPFTGYAMSDVVQAAEDADPVIVYPVAIGGDSTTTAYFTGLADGTGGEVFTAANASEIVEAIMEAIEVIIYSPFADAGGPYEGEVGQAIVFDASGSYDPDGEIILYEWDWDPDGIYDYSTTEPVCDHTWSFEFSGTVRMRVTDNDGLSNIDTAEVTVLESTPPDVEIIVPAAGAAVQDGVTLTADAYDISGVTEVYFYLREPNDGNGVPIGHEDLPGTLNIVTGNWEYAFDTTVLDDGYYVILAKAVDTYGNEGWSEVVPFSIRNWAVVELLPASREYRAGRTMPVKFSLRIAESVDATMPFVYNEELEIRIYKSSAPGNILQTSLFGDTARDYRIDSLAELYITNFKTEKRPAEYTVEIWRASKNFLVGSFTFETKRK